MTNPLAPLATQAEVRVDTSPIHAENLCKRKISEVKSIKEKLKAKNEMLKSSLENDQEFSQLQEAVEEARQQLNARKSVLVNTPAIATIVQDIREIKEEKKEAQLSLFGSLESYVAATNSYEIEDDEGETHTIRKEFKISKI